MAEPKQKILVAEDDIAFRRVIQLVLQNAGFDVTMAPNGRIAFELFESGEFDMVVTDHQMPEMSGTEFCNRIRNHSHRANTPVLMLSAKVFEMDETQLREKLGVTDFLIKPFNPATLVDTVAKHIAANTVAN